MAGPDPVVLALFLESLKGHFQENRWGLAARLAVMCQSLVASGQEEHPTYKVVASALRTIVVVGRIDPHSLPGASFIRELNEDGPVFIPNSSQAGELPQAASGLGSQTTEADLPQRSMPLPTIPLGRANVAPPSRLEILQQNLSRFAAGSQGTTAAVSAINPLPQQAPASAPQTNSLAQLFPMQSTSQIQPQPFPVGADQPVMQPRPYSRAPMPVSQAQAAAFRSQQAFMQNQSRSLPQSVPTTQSSLASNATAPFMPQQTFLQNKLQSLPHFGATSHSSLSNGFLSSSQRRPLQQPLRPPDPTARAYASSSQQVTEAVTSATRDARFGPHQGDIFKPGFTSSPREPLPRLPQEQQQQRGGPFGFSSAASPTTAFRRVSDFSGFQYEGRTGGPGLPSSGQSLNPIHQPASQSVSIFPALSKGVPEPPSKRVTAFQNGPAALNGSLWGRASEEGDGNTGRTPALSNLREGGKAVSQDAANGAAVVSVQPASESTKPGPSKSGNATTESVRACIHQRARAVLANGGEVELKKLMTSVEILSKSKQVLACFHQEQRRQLVAQINIYQNVKHRKPSSQATIGLALEDLKKPLPKPSNGQGVWVQRVQTTAKAPVKRGKQPLTEEEKQTAKEKDRERRRLRRVAKRAEKAAAGIAGQGSLSGGAKSAAAPLPSLMSSASAKTAAGMMSAAPTRTLASARSGETSSDSRGRLIGSKVPRQQGSISQAVGKSHKRSDLQTPASRNEPSSPAPPPVDIRKPPLVENWLLKFKADRIVEVAKQTQLHERLKQSVASKASELKQAAALPTEGDSKTRQVIELRKLELLQLQQKMRREVMDDFFRPAREELQNVRQTKFAHSLKWLRELDKREAKQREDRAKRKKEKVKDFVKAVEQHKLLLAEVQKAKKERVMRNNRLVVEFHKRKERIEREKKERLQREKIEALKSNDVEGYMKLVQDAKSDRVRQLLKETESYLHKLGTKLAQVTRQARDAASGEGLAAAEPTCTSAPEASLLESNEKYYTLAHAVTEVVVKQPEMLVGGQLREYQMKGLQWMVSLYNNKLNGILADEMGLGKTIQVIALLCYLMETKREAGPFLIVVPSSVFSNWISEFKRWAPSAKLVPYRGNPDTRKRIYSEHVASGNFDILLTTYEFLMNKHDRPRLSKVKWAHLIIDEGHRIKNANCKLNTDLKQYRAKNRLLLTGTPIQNNLDELWTLLNFLLPEIFNSSDDFGQWFNKPFEETGLEEEEDQALLNEEENLLVINRLHQVLRPFMLRRMKEKVADELPGKVERLIRCEASAYQKLLAKQVSEKLGRFPGQTKGKAVQNTVMELRNICNHPYLSLLHVEDVEYSLNEHFLPTAVRLCGKLEMLDRILPKLKVGGHKVLFFCTMTRLLDIMEDYLLEKGYGYLRLDGATSGSDRGALIDEFNAPDSQAFIFLLSLRAGGIGINLQTADTVIIYDTDWNPQVDLQAQARAHRIGQKKDVLVLRMETVNTVEEKIRARAEHKMGVATQSITAGFFDQSTSAEDRREFLEAILREANADRTESTDVPDDDQLNVLLSRSPEELDLFAAEDRKRRQEDELRWRAIKGSETAPDELPRLITEAELQPVLEELEKANQDCSRSTSVDTNEELGRGRRARDNKKDMYQDLTQRQFNYLLREGTLPPSAAKKQSANGEELSVVGKKRKRGRPPSEEPRNGKIKKARNGHPMTEAHVVAAGTPTLLDEAEEKQVAALSHPEVQDVPRVEDFQVPAGTAVVPPAAEQFPNLTQVDPPKSKRQAEVALLGSDEFDEDAPIQPSKKQKRAPPTSPPSRSGVLALPSPPRASSGRGLKLSPQQVTVSTQIKDRDKQIENGSLLHLHGETEQLFGAEALPHPPNKDGELRQSCERSTSSAMEGADVQSGLQKTGTAIDSATALKVTNEPVAPTDCGLATALDHVVATALDPTDKPKSRPNAARSLEALPAFDTPLPATSVSANASNTQGQEASQNGLNGVVLLLPGRPRKEVNVQSDAVDKLEAEWVCNSDDTGRLPRIAPQRKLKRRKTCVTAKEAAASSDGESDASECAEKEGVLSSFRSPSSASKPEVVRVSASAHGGCPVEEELHEQQSLRKLGTFPSCKVEGTLGANGNISERQSLEVSD